jgi:hypothetical protein
MICLFSKVKILLFTGEKFGLQVPRNGVWEGVQDAFPPESAHPLAQEM